MCTEYHISVNMYHVSAQGVDERMINVHYYYYYYYCYYYYYYYECFVCFIYPFLCILLVYCHCRSMSMDFGLVCFVCYLRPRKKELVHTQSRRVKEVSFLTKSPTNFCSVCHSVI